MKQVNWIFEKDLFEEYEQKLVSAIKSSGANCILYDDNHDVNLQQSLAKRLKPDDVVIFHGSLQLANRVLKQTAYYPGVYLTLENYECYKYYGFYGDHLLNSNYLMMGLNDVLRNKEFIFNTFKTNSIFIRPSNGFKSFTGQCLSKENFEFEFNVLTKSYGGLETDILVLISPPKEITEEYRFIVIDKKIISGALYMNEENRKNWKADYYTLCTDEKALEYANSLIHLYEPDKCFNMDICKLKTGEYKLIEINSFCCGSLYGNDYDKIVAAVNNVVLDDYNDVN